MNKINKKPNIGIWCAVSSKAQAADDKISLTAQEQAGRDLAKAIDGHVVAVYRVPGHTRDIIFWHDAERAMDAYHQLRQDVQAGHLDVLHAMDADRLGRDPALSNQLVSLCEKNGCEVYLASNPHIIGQKSSAQRYIFAITSTRAGEDQQRRKEYHRTGMIARIERGLHPNHLPTGYTTLHDARGRVTGAELSNLAPAIHLAGELFIRGHTYADIATQLGQAGYQPRKADHWDHTVVRRLLHKDIYGGIVTWGEYHAKTDKIPPIWDTDLYTAIVQERKKRAGARGRRRHSYFWKVVYCDRCGATMGLLTDKHDPDQSRLFCQTQHNYRTCYYNSILLTKIRTAIDTHLDRLFSLPNLNTAFEEYDITPRLQDSIEGAEKQIKTTKQKRTRLALILAGNDMNVAVYRAADDKLIEDLENINAKLADLHTQLANASHITTRIDMLEELKKHTTRLWDMPAVECNALLRHLELRVTVANNRVSVVKLV